MKRKCAFLFFLLVTCTITSVTIPQSTWSAEKPKDYPNKPVSIWYGTPPGGPSDIGARMVSESLTRVLGVPVLVESKPGAGHQIMLTDFINNAKPDGYVMPYISVPQTQSLVYDPARKAIFTMKDFQPVANHVIDPNCILVRMDSPFKTLDDIVVAAKKKPGEITVSTSGIGSDDHFAALMFEVAGGLKFNIIHTAGTAAALPRVLGGHIDILMDNVGGLSHIAKAGQGRILAVMLDKRHPDIPDVPTFREKGLDVVASSSRGFVLPKGTPMTIVKYMEQSIKKAMEDPEHVKRAKNAGLTIGFMGVEEYSKFLENVNVRIPELIKLYRK